MKTTASTGSRPLGTNALGVHIKRLRVDAAKAVELTKAIPTPASSLEVSFYIFVVCAYHAVAHTFTSHLFLQIMLYSHCHPPHHHHCCQLQLHPVSQRNGEVPLMVVEQRLKRSEPSIQSFFFLPDLVPSVDCLFLHYWL
jgi:hypothetical protein